MDENNVKELSPAEESVSVPGKTGQPVPVCPSEAITPGDNVPAREPSDTLPPDKAPVSPVSSEETLPLSLTYGSHRQVAMGALLGVFIGLAVIVPGVSGAAVAIIFGLYEKLLCAMGDLLRRPCACLRFLLPVLLGALVGFAGGFFGVQKLLDVLPFAVVALFAGLMAGSYPAITGQLSGAVRTPGRIALFILGILIPVAVAIGSVVLPTGAGSLEDPGFGKYFCFLLLGYAVAITQIVPGLSATALLMIFGYFTSLMKAVTPALLHDLPTLGLFLALGVGFLIGLLTFSRVLTALLTRFHAPVFFTVAGLSLGAVVTMFFNPEICAVYTSWARDGIVWWELILGILLFAAALPLAWRLVRLEQGKGIAG